MQVREREIAWVIGLCAIAGCAEDASSDSVTPPDPSALGSDGQSGTLQDGGTPALGGDGATTADAEGGAPTCAADVIASGVVQTFTLREPFGVTFGKQLVTFDLNRVIKPENTYLLDGSGNEVPYQFVSGAICGKIAVYTDLPKNTTFSYSLNAGKAPAATLAGAVKVDESNADYDEITNGITGVRVAKVYSPVADPPKFPIQGVLFRDGKWSPSGSVLTLPMATVKSMSVTFVERGPLRTVINVRYDLDAKEDDYGSELVRPAGPGFYSTTIELQSGQPSVLIETETDVRSRADLSFYEGTHPKLLRYQGHDASDPVYGHLTDGSIYPWSHTRPPEDALVDVDYGKNVEVGWTTAPDMRLPMQGWNPWSSNTGWYWEMYDPSAQSNNAIGIFAGAPSRLIAAGISGPGVYTRTGPDAGITVTSELHGADNSLMYFETEFHKIRYAWGIFSGTVADVPPVLTDISTLSKQYSLFGNGVNLDKLAHWQLTDYPDPPQGYGAPYIAKAQIDALISRVRTDDDFFNVLWNESPQEIDIWGMWKDTTGAAAHKMVTDVHTQLANLVDDWANGFGFTSVKYVTQPWLLPAPKLDRYDQLLANEYVTADEKKSLKSDAAFFANWLWDLDVYPVAVDSKGNVIAGVSMGSPNMPMQWVGTRNNFTWYLSNHPVLAGHLQEAVPNWYQISDLGSPNTCPHYSGTLTPQFSLAEQRTKLGYHDWTDPKLAKYGEWELNIVTAPDVRFGGKRAYVVMGNSEPDLMPSTFAEHATAAATDNPELSKRLMWIWANNGKPYGDFYGASIFRIDPSLPTQDPQLSNATFPDYFTVLRNGWNTPLETSVHAFNGPWYADHRGGDSGAFVIFGIGVPLSLYWESMYTPIPASSLMQNMVVPESGLGGMAWNGDITDTWKPGDPWDWKTQGQDLFASFTLSGAVQFHSGGGDLTWTRSVKSIHPTDEHPLILIQDSFSGAHAGDAMVFTMTQMADGAVGTPAGPVTPTTRFYDVNGTKDLPSGGAAYGLSAGLNRFSFTGKQFGTAGVTPAIDWDLYEVSPGSQEFAIGSWGHNAAGFASNDYPAANGGQPYEQRQHLLHLKGAGGFTTLVVPHRKGQSAPSVSMNGSALVVQIDGATTNVDGGGYSFDGPTATAITSYSAAAESGSGISVQGGATEVKLDKASQTITITAHGPAGTRQISLPGAWKVVSGSLTSDGGSGWQLAYGGGAPATAVLQRP